MAENLYLKSIKKAIGKPRKYTAEKLLEKFVEYIEDCEKNPIKVATRLVGKKMNGEKNSQEQSITTIQRPLTISGFCVYAGIGNWHQYRKDNMDRDDNYRSVFHAIELAVRANQIEGGLTKVYDGNLAARLNGLNDATNLSVSVAPTMSWEDFKAKLGNAESSGDIH